MEFFVSLNPSPTKHFLQEITINIVINGLKVPLIPLTAALLPNYLSSTALQELSLYNSPLSMVTM